MSEWVVSTEGLGKEYGEITAVADLNFRVAAGRVVALVGPNGAGKSTTMKMLMGLVRPTTGGATVLGRDAVNESLAVRQQVGYVPEDDAVYDWMTVDRALALARSLYPKWDPQTVAEALERFGLRRRQRVGDMSRGMRRQLAITLALAIRPRLLILDEPTASLDPERKRDFFALLFQQVAERGCAVLISSHQLHEIERIVDEVAFLRQGRLQAQTSLDDLKAQERQIRVVFQNQPPEGLKAWPGVAAVEIQGRTCTLTVTGDLDEVMARLRSHNPFAVEVIDRNLEDLYFALQEEGEAGGAPDAPDR